MTGIIRSGMQIMDSRKNANRKDEDKKVDAIVEPKYIKFYEAISAAIDDAKARNKNPKAMFRCEIIHPKEDGTPTVSTISYEFLAPDTIATFLDIMNTRLSPPKARSTRTGSTPGANDSAGGDDDGTNAGGPEGGDDAPAVDDAAKAAADKKAADDKAAADKKAADDKAASDKKAAEKKAADDKKAADAKNVTPAATTTPAAPAANGKSAADKARETAAAAQKKAEEATKETTPPPAEGGEDFNGLFDEDPAG
jgi:hypothetical protein